MYEYLKGVLTKITPTYIVVEVSGIGYILNVANPYSYSHLMNSDVKIYVHQVIRDDAHSLYAFMNESEKNLFLKLISVSGIGPKSALAILATADNEGLVEAIHASDIKYLTKFPGVGKKTAMQMVLDLEGKFEIVAGTVQDPVANNENVELEEAMEALVALGYRATELKKVRTKLEATQDTTEGYIKTALRMMMG
ncbi:Holliday junction DNA helicase RuvA [Floricoccus tropicus]|uniref:Holliday junction branch migration complex subunit RuvA n=1 Tax=Floricoccus tropicus TaxID=1859473 RepID=A0A1E8GL75_9LACT|nr:MULTISPECIES: Holliday junction branch migration protein RuvA [Floricoccus]OFI48979.1 Holliday junction DNA helicase RuvA [Floricoccus tropicus]URZ87332.1 Holliday junction branch migration protein RuvA [Floricoccus penangensis]